MATTLTFEEVDQHIIPEGWKNALTTFTDVMDVVCAAARATGASR